MLFRSEVTSGNSRQIEVEEPMEIRPLVKEINRLLVLVERRLLQSRTAIGNLAHALKTPLAILFRIAEHPSMAQNPELQNMLHQQNQVIHQRIEREFKRARLSGNMQTAVAFNPREELAALIDLLDTIYADKNLAFRLNAPDRPLHYDREDLLELTGNLLDNACKWAAHRINIEIGDWQGVSVVVEDDGPGCSEADMQLLTQRGIRLDENVSGHGLGLAIVSDIVDFYHGELSISRSEALGGLRVEARISN